MKNELSLFHGRYMCKPLVFKAWIDKEKDEAPTKQLSSSESVSFFAPIF